MIDLEWLKAPSDPASAFSRAGDMVRSGELDGPDRTEDRADLVGVLFDWLEKDVEGEAEIVIEWVKRDEADPVDSAEAAGCVHSARGRILIPDGAALEAGPGGRHAFARDE